MGYRVESAMWSGVFAVPDKLVDKHLKLCGGAALKVLLIILRGSGEVIPEKIAGLLDLPVADVLDAINYWAHLGVLTEDTADTAPEKKEAEEISPISSADSAPAQPSNCGGVTEESAPKLRSSLPEPEPKPERASATAPGMPGSFRRRLTTRQVNEMSRGDKNIEFVLQEAQAVLGKPLTPVATDTVAALYSYYGMQPEVILMLLQYCVSLGKDNMRYVEKVAAGWLEAGIDSHEKAEREILRAGERDKLENIIRRLFGISDRALISSEREYVNSWKDQGIPVELIGVAYERAIEQKGKLSFAYVNGILQNWRAKGIANVRQALEEMQRGKKGAPPATDEAGQDEMEHIFKYGDI